MRALTATLLLLPYVIGASQIPLFVELPSRTSTLNSPSPAPTEVQDGQTGTLIVMPPAQTFNGTKHIPGICFNLP